MEYWVRVHAQPRMCSCSIMDASEFVLTCDDQVFSKLMTASWLQDFVPSQTQLAECSHVSASAWTTDISQPSVFAAVG